MSFRSDSESIGYTERFSWYRCPGPGSGSRSALPLRICSFLTNGSTKYCATCTVSASLPFPSKKTKYNPSGASDSFTIEYEPKKRTSTCPPGGSEKFSAGAIRYQSPLRCSTMAGCATESGRIRLDAILKNKFQFESDKVRLP